MGHDGLLLKTAGLTKNFGGLKAVDGIDFALAAGDLRAVIGPNGAGKTTFFNLITGLFPPTSGRIHFRGEDITGFAPHRVSQKGIGRTLQLTSLFSGLTVWENVWIAAQSRHRFFNPLVHYSTLRDVAEKTREVLRLLGLTEKSDEVVANLSHGDQRLLEIGVALSTSPSLLLLDEPTAGLSPRETQEITQTIPVLAQGRVIAEGSPEAIRGDPRVREAYLGAD